MNQTKILRKSAERLQAVVASDAKATQLLLQHRQHETGAVLMHQEFIPEDKVNKQPSQDSVIIIAAPFQGAVLRELGREMALLDAMGGTNKYGHAFSTALVACEFGNGLPVGLMITSSEAAGPVRVFLQTLQKAACELGTSPETELMHSSAATQHQMQTAAIQKELLSTSSALQPPSSTDQCMPEVAPCASDVQIGSVRSLVPQQVSARTAKEP